VVKTTPTPPSKAQDPSGGVDVGESLAGSRPQKVELKETLPPAALQEPAPVVAENGTDPDSSDVEPRRPQQEPRVDAASELSTADAAGVPPDKATDGAAEPGSGDVAADSGTPTRRGDHGLLRSPNVSIASPWVKRFLLAKDVVGNEPQGDIDDVALTDNGYAEVSSFSEVIDQKGETLQYRWLHEGREVLRIRVAVGANRWRSHSTKRIYAQMKGSWRAELRNSAGELLASIDFTF
jgi:hypothetical protein